MKARIMHAFHTRIFLTVICVSLVPIILCFAVMLPLMIASSDSRQTQHADAQLDAMCTQLGIAFVQMDESLRALSAAPQVAAICRGEAKGQDAYGLLAAQAQHMDTEIQLMVISPTGDCLCALRGTEAEQHFAPDWGVLRSARDEETVFTGEIGCVLAVRRADMGYVLAELSGDALSSLLTAGRDAACGVMLLTAQWRLIDDSQAVGSQTRLDELRERLLLGRPLTQADDVLVYSTRVEPVSGLTLLLSQPRVFTGEMKRMLTFIGVLMGAASLVLCVWGALVLSRTISRPVQEMTAAMQRVERGELTVRMTQQGEDELGRLAAGFNRMVDEYEQNLRRSVERQRELNETRIRMMQAQLNPHFLYNTLDAMKWMGVTHGVPQAASLAEDLAIILRASISGKEFVPLQQEIELLERYIDIQLIRFADRFACEVEVRDALMNCLVPKLVLQPIVENAVIHGVRDMDDGYIKVWAESSEGELRLYVQDNGRGMDAVQDGPLSFGVSGKPGEHLGLFNVDSILRLHFGDAYGLSVRSQPGKGCMVLVRLPMRRAEPSNGEEDDE